MADRLKTGVSVEPGPLAVDLSAIHGARSAVVHAERRPVLRVAFERIPECGAENVTASDRYRPIRRLLLESDVEFLKSLGMDWWKARAFRADRRKQYWDYVRSFELEVREALESRKACMASRGEWDFPSVLRQMRGFAVIGLKLRWAGVCHLLHAPVDVAWLVEAPIQAGWSLISAAELPAAG